MSIKTRIITLVLGIGFTIAGGLLTYFEFFGKHDNWYTDTGYFPLGTLITGIVLVIVAFEKKKKTSEQEGTDPAPKS
ncbi:MAG TPA: hypothetical protein VGO58_08155 [Chitinophagaceae bacterium]|jgi:hypothetical protein|nr:hypothetical protein [Chitinophagaceae bacterium]